MFGMGFGEIILLGGIALVVIGPEKFPDFAKMVIKTVRDLRGYVDEMKSEVTKELSPLKNELNPLKKELDSLSRIDPEKYIDSLTGDDSDPNASESKSSTPENPSINEEDQKIMAVADAETYGEDPYGWQEGEEGEYGADKGAYPDDTVSYGEEQNEDAGEATMESSDDDEEEGEQKEASAEPDLEVPEDDRIESTDDPTEPDAWT